MGDGMRKARVLSAVYNATDSQALRRLLRDVRRWLTATTM
jgi:hypothetical protein